MECGFRKLIIKSEVSTLKCDSPFFFVIGFVLASHRYWLLRKILMVFYGLRLVKYARALIGRLGDRL